MSERGKGRVEKCELGETERDGGHVVAIGGRGE